MSEYHDEKATRALESMAKSMQHIEKQLENLNRTLKPLPDCVEKYPNGRSEFNISND